MLCFQRRPLSLRDLKPVEALEDQTVAIAGKPNEVDLAMKASWWSQRVGFRVVPLGAYTLDAEKVPTLIGMKNENHGKNRAVHGCLCVVAVSHLTKGDEPFTEQAMGL